MIFFAITPILIGAFGNFCIPLEIGARDMAFPLLNMLSFWVFTLAGILAIASFFVPSGTGAAGWTTYPPLSTTVGTPGIGQTLIVVALFLTGVSTIMGAVNYVTTVIRFRAPGHDVHADAAHGLGPLAHGDPERALRPGPRLGRLLLLFDRTFDTQFFVAGASRGAAATRCSSSTCSGSSATPRSTS